MSEHSEIHQNVEGVEYAATSASGDATVIINYYYREQTRISPVEPDDAADENLLCPYRGLFHFGPNDAEFFFGREVFIEELFQATRTRNFIPVLGASGSGKSSVVFAGLVPRLQQEGHWQFTHFRPGSEPFQALAEALVPLYEPEKNTTEQMHQARQLAGYFNDGSVHLQDVFARIQRNYPNYRILLIADQFEELYSLCSDETIRRSFLDTLLAGFQNFSSNSQSLPVLVATMRANFLGNALSYPPFGDVLQNTDIKIRSMNREELAQVIERPAEKVGVNFEAGLVEYILNDVKNEAGNLPLLEFALTELWKRRVRTQLTHKAYKAIDKVQGALVRHADEKYNQLSKTEQEQVEKIFIQLVHPNEGIENTRKLATKEELGDKVNWELVTKLANARLVVTSRNAAEQETVEIVHEALISKWGKLQQWMETNRTFRAWQERLRSGVRQWKRHNKQEGYLLRDGLLREAEDWLKERRDDLGQEERQFIKLSLALRRRNNRLIIGTAVFVLLLALSLTGISVWQGQVSNQERLKAEIESQSLTALQQFELAPLEALNLAIKSGQNLKSLVNKDQPVDSYPVVSPLLALQTIEDNISQTNQIETHQEGVNSVRIISGNSQDKSDDKREIIKEVATAGEDGTVKRLTNKGELIFSFKDKYSNKSINSLDYKLDNNKSPVELVTAGEDGYVRRWDLKGHLIKKFKTYNNEDNDDKTINNIRYSKDGKQLITSGKDGYVRRWDIDGNNIKNFPAHQSHKEIIEKIKKTTDIAKKEEQLLRIYAHKTGGIISLNINRDNKLIATAGEDGSAKLWNFDGQELARFDDNPSGSINSIWFSEKDNKIATAGEDGYVRLWILRGSGKQTPVKEFEAHKDGVESVRISNDNKLIATAGHLGTVRLWNLEGKPIAAFNGHQGSVPSMRFSDDSQTLVTSGQDDGTVRLWDVQKKPYLTQLKCRNGKVKLEDWKDPIDKPDRPIQLICHGQRINSVRFSNNNPEFTNRYLIATASDDGKVNLWNFKNGELLNTFNNKNPAKSVRFSPDNSQIATAGEDGIVRLWNINTKSTKPSEIITDHNSGINTVNFNHDGNILATSSEDGTVKLWDLSKKGSTKLLKTFGQFKFNELPNPVVSFRFSPTENKIAIVGNYGMVKVCDIAKTTTECKPFSGHEGTVYAVSFNSDGKEIITAGDDGTIRRYNLFEKTKNEPVKTYQGSVKNISVSNNGKLIAAGGGKGTVRLWNLSGKQIAEFKGHLKNVRSVNFIQDNTWLVTAGDDGTAIIWPVRTLDELLEKGSEWLKYYSEHNSEKKN